MGLFHNNERQFKNVVVNAKCDINMKFKADNDKNFVLCIKTKWFRHMSAYYG